MMPDRKKVIKGLETCYCPPAKCENCPYHDLPDEQSCNNTLCLDALELLKEHEPVKVKDCADIVDGIQVGYCPKCDRKIVWNPEKEETVAFCKYCGQAVKWE